MGGKGHRVECNRQVPSNLPKGSRQSQPPPAPFPTAVRQEVRVPLGSAAYGSREVEVCELFGTHLLTKRACGPLQIRDIVADTLRRAALLPPASWKCAGHGGCMLSWRRLPAVAQPLPAVPRPGWPADASDCAPAAWVRAGRCQRRCLACHPPSSTCPSITRSWRFTVG